MSTASEQARSENTAKETIKKKLFEQTKKETVNKGIREFYEKKKQNMMTQLLKQIKKQTAEVNKAVKGLRAAEKKEMQSGGYRSNALPITMQMENWRVIDARSKLAETQRLYNEIKNLENNNFANIERTKIEARVQRSGPFENPSGKLTGPEYNYYYFVKQPLWKRILGYKRFVTNKNGLAVPKPTNLPPPNNKEWKKKSRWPWTR